MKIILPALYGRCEKYIFDIFKRITFFKFIFFTFPIYNDSLYTNPDPYIHISFPISQESK